MASSAKRKTTMAKLNRERRLLEKRAEKQAKKLARKRAAAEPDVAPFGDETFGDEPAADDAQVAPAADATR
jgi:hypothetical protein